MKMREVLFIVAAGILGAACTTTATQPARAAVAELPVLEGMTPSEDLASIAGLLAEKPAKKTLLVLDIDDTLLTSTTFYGSDAWYEWQKELKEDDKRRLRCRFDAIAINTEIGTQKATQPNAAAIVNPLMLRQDTLMLTSRNPSARGATLRELAEARISLPPALNGLKDGISYRFPENVDRKEQKTVVYDEGVFMTQGQNKGKVLISLLRRLWLSYDRVVLVDDGFANHQNMSAALKEAGVEYRGLLYHRIPKTVDDATAKRAAEDWTLLLESMRTVFKDRVDRWEDTNEPCAY